MRCPKCGAPITEDCCYCDGILCIECGENIRPAQCNGRCNECGEADVEQHQNVLWLEDMDNYTLVKKEG